MNIKKLIGNRIKEIRKSKNLTQERLAELINIEPTSLSNIENGKYYPTAENIEKIMIALNIKPSELFKIEHLQSNDELISEINQLLSNNPDKIKTFYKILKDIIND